jgi:hypothetical protein
MSTHAGRSCLLIALLVSGVAAAQGRDPAAAELLFREGRRLLAEGRIEEACGKLAESQRLDPAAGTLINLAACEESLGKLASAWEKWQQVLRLLPSSDDRRPGVAERSRALEGRLPYLELRLQEGSPPGSVVVRGGVELGSASLGLYLPVDPGEHRIFVRAPGHLPSAISVALAESERKSIVVAPGPPLPPEAQIAPPPPAEPLTAPPAAPPPEAESGSSRPLGFAIAGIGAVGIAVGAVTGLLAIDKRNEMNEDCERVGSDLECGQTGFDAARAGTTLATVSTIAFAAGFVGLGVGGWLILSNPRSSAGPSAALGVNGRF